MTRKFHHNVIVLMVTFVLILSLFYPIPASAHPEVGQSVNVAVIDTLYIINGGVFPTSTTGAAGSFLDFNFFTLPVASVGIAALGPGGICGADGCDTVVLNVASGGMGCNINNLTSQQKSDLVTFVAGGYKLIIYDSECPPQDYSWLPFSFTTSNPGALGAQGTLSIVEENTLSSNDPANPHYIDAGMLSIQTDAVGDMNVMTTFDPNWFIDMSGTNVLNVTGPVHTYARYPSGADYGLIIYNGLDVDFMNSGTVPDASTPAGNLAKMWLHELQQPFNPSRLPGGVPVVGILLTPPSATLSSGQDHTVTATISDLLAIPQPGVQVTFSIEAGPNAGALGTCSANSDCTTDTNGQVSFSYIGSGGVGTDQIIGCFTNGVGQVICSQLVSVEWVQVTQSEIDYFAIGDSLASGHGLKDDDTDCRRSANSYPYLVAEMLKERFNTVNFPTHEENGQTIYHHLACSGATLREPETATSEEYKWFEKQVDYVVANLSDRPTLVSITIGANDFGWSNIPQFLARLKWNMEDDTKYIDWVDKLVDKPETGLEALLKVQIERLLAYPNVSVVVTEIHNPINPLSSLFAGTHLANACGWIADACFVRTQYAVGKLNLAIVGIVVDIGQFDRLQAASIQNDFSGHEAPPVCGLKPISDTYIQYPGDGYSNSYSVLPGWLRKALKINRGGDCFHPNLEGANIYANSVNEDAIRVGR